LLDVFHGYLVESNIGFAEVNNAKKMFLSAGPRTGSARGAFGIRLRDQE